MKEFSLEEIKKEIEKFIPKKEVENIGKILKVGDGVAWTEGLSEAFAEEIVEIETKEGKVKGFIFTLERDRVGIVILGDTEKVKEGDIVKRTKRILSIGVGKEALSRVINPLGEPLDGKGEIKFETFYPLERIAPGVTERAPVDTPLQTGIKAIDSMIPIGRGQRELILGDRQTGKTTIAIDTILNQKDQNVVCIYVAIGQKRAKVAQIVEELEEKGALEYTVIVSATSSDPASLQYLAPYAGCAIGEYFMHQGKDALVVYDDLSKHAQAYRELALVLGRPPGREAYPGDIFYLHSRLLERAAKLSPEKGGGSLTALPIIETQAGDISAYIPTNVISITDGQIYLEPELFYRGIRPAINVGLSVSRVGSAAQIKAMKKVAGRLRLELAQYRELEAFAQFTTDLDEQTKKTIERGRRLTEILKQWKGEPLPVEKQVVIIFAGVKGFLDDISVEKVKEFEKELLKFIELKKKDILEKIKTTKDLDESTERDLTLAIEEFKKIFKA